VQILADLPEDEQDFFLYEYEEHINAARNPAGWNQDQLRWLLRLWRFYADETKKPGY
jgi:hypothetical protein